jgi:hypothetical protein
MLLVYILLVYICNLLLRLDMKLLLPLPQDLLMIGKRVLPLYWSPPFILFMVPLPLPTQPISFLLPIHCWVSCRAFLVLNLFCAFLGGVAYSCFALSCCWTWLVVRWALVRFCYCTFVLIWYGSRSCSYLLGLFDLERVAGAGYGYPTEGGDAYYY